MIVTLPVDKVNRIVQACVDLQKRNHANIREVARVLGLLVSTFSAVEFAPLYYRNTEREKINALTEKRGDYESTMMINKAIKVELQWWIDNLSQQKRRISHGNPSIVITCDASNQGWGSVCENVEIGG